MYNSLLRTCIFMGLLPVLLVVSSSLADARKVAQLSPTQYWVSPNGSDTGKGTASDPFLTIDRARMAVRSNPLRGKTNLIVNIESGTYALTAPIVFDSNDSGSSKAGVIYRAAPGSDTQPIISGGIPVSGFTCIANICTASVSGVPSGVLPRQFYVNDQRAMRARTNVGQVVNLNYTRGPLGYTQIIPQPITHPELVEAVNVTQWKMNRCPIAAQLGTTLVMGNPCWDNANSYSSPWNFQLLSWLENAPEFLTAPNMWYYDPYSHQLTYYSTGTFPDNAVLPIQETLLSIQGTPSAPVTNITFQGLQFSYATWLEPNSPDGYATDQSENILRGSGYQPNVIGHQLIVYKTPGNISVGYARDIAFISNTFTHLGGVALDLGTGTQNSHVLDNVFTDISSAAIQIGGVQPYDARPNDRQVTKNNLVKNNDISYTGQEYYDSAGIYVGFTTGTVITHNNISHTPWTGVAIGWGWGLLDKPSFPGLPKATPGMWGTFDTPTIASNNEISSNKFDHFLEQLWDGGAIYTNGAQGPDYAHGLLLKLNVAEDKRPLGGGNIYYTDGGSKFVTLDQNVSINDPVGIADFGPCFTGSSIPTYCLLTGAPYGSDFGGCLPVGDLTYQENYFLDPADFYGPQICQNPLIPPFPVNLKIANYGPITSPSQVPESILNQAGRQ